MEKVLLGLSAAALLASTGLSMASANTSVANGVIQAGITNVTGDPLNIIAAGAGSGINVASDKNKATDITVVTPSNFIKNGSFTTKVYFQDSSIGGGGCTLNFKFTPSSGNAYNATSLVGNPVENGLSCQATYVNAANWNIKVSKK